MDATMTHLVSYQPQKGINLICWAYGENVGPLNFVLACQELVSGHYNLFCSPRTYGKGHVICTIHLLVPLRVRSI